MMKAGTSPSLLFFWGPSRRAQAALSRETLLCKAHISCQNFAMVRLTILLLAAFLLPSCETISFYTQAVRGQAQITLSRRPIQTVLKDKRTPPELAAKLRLAQRLVAFAESELALDSSGSYQHYTDLKREHVTYIVYGAPEFSLAPKVWWYPVIGGQNYRGYFQEEDANKLVNQLKAQGLDTYTGGVDAYSTLGFLNDPLLNTFIDYPEVDLAELIFHELTHHRYYEPDNTPKNEALAEVVAREGTRRWLRQQGDREALKTYELRLQRRAQIRQRITLSIGNLEELYARELPEEVMRKKKALELQRLRNDIQALYAGWQQKPNNFLSTPLNNARLNAFTTYEAFVPPFEKLLARHNFELESFFQEIEQEHK